MLERILSSLQSQRKCQCQFHAIMRCAEDIASKYPPALVDLVRLLGRTLQAERIAQLVVEGRERRPPAQMHPEQLLFDRGLPLAENGQSFFKLCEVREERRALALHRDIILPWPWSRSRLAGALAYIGEGKSAGAWTHDDSNHRVEWWLPIGVGFVNGGNHSLTAGIVRGEGIVIASSVCNIAPVYEYVYCDGCAYRLHRTRQPLCRVSNVVFAGMFEIGRLMLHYNVSA